MRVRRSLLYSFSTFFLLAAVAVPDPGAEARAASFTGLGILPGGTYSLATAVDADGSVIGGISSPPAVGQAFLWAQGIGLIPSGVSGSQVYAASEDGNVLAGYMPNSQGHTEAFRWPIIGGLTGIGDLTGGNFYSTARGASRDGSVIVGTSTSAAGDEAFRWTAAGGMVGLGDLPGGLFLSVAYAVSADGAVVAGSGYGDSGQEAFIWTEADGMIGISGTAAAFTLSADGTTAGGTTGNQGFVWTAIGGLVLTGDLPGGAFYSRVMAISGDGSLAAGMATNANNEWEAFIWDADHGIRSLRDVLVNDYGLGTELAGWTLESVWGVSEDGKALVGKGMDPEGNNEAWRALLGDMPPPPVGVPLRSGAPAPTAWLPNPTSGMSRLHLGFDLATNPDGMRLEILDVTGRTVRRLSVPVSGGDLRWDTRDDEGRWVPSGVYFGRLVARGAGVPPAAIRVLR